jgi:hypothetical protein
MLELFLNLLKKVRDAFYLAKHSLFLYNGYEKRVVGQAFFMVAKIMGAWLALEGRALVTQPI